MADVVSPEGSDTCGEQKTEEIQQSCKKIKVEQTMEDACKGWACCLDDDEKVKHEPLDVEGRADYSNCSHDVRIMGEEDRKDTLFIDINSMNVTSETSNHNQQERLKRRNTCLWEEAPKSPKTMALSRSQNLSMDERLLLISLFRDKSSILLNKKTDGRMVNLKAKAWEDITNAMNSAGLGPVRSVKQMRKIWENMKGRAKKVAAEQRKELFRTKSGIPDQKVEVDTVSEQMLAIFSGQLLPTELDLNCDIPERSVDVAQIINFEDEGIELPTEKTSIIYRPLEDDPEYYQRAHSIPSISRPASAPANPGLVSQPNTPPSRPSSALSQATHSTSAGASKRRKRSHKFDGTSLECYKQVADNQRLEHQLIMKINAKKFELLEAKLKAIHKEEERREKEEERRKELHKVELDRIAEERREKKKICEIACHLLEDCRIAVTSAFETPESLNK